MSVNRNVSSCAGGADTGRGYPRPRPGPNQARASGGSGRRAAPPGSHERSPPVPADGRRRYFRLLELLFAAARFSFRVFWAGFFEPRRGFSEPFTTPPSRDGQHDEPTPPGGGTGSAADVDRRAERQEPRERRDPAVRDPDAAVAHVRPQGGRLVRAVDADLTGAAAEAVE